MYFQIYLNAFFVFALLLCGFLSVKSLPSSQNFQKHDGAKVNRLKFRSLPQCEDMMHGALLILKKKEPFREIFLVNFSLSL